MTGHLTIPYAIQKESVCIVKFYLMFSSVDGLEPLSLSSFYYCLCPTREIHLLYFSFGLFSIEKKNDGKSKMLLFPRTVGNASNGDTCFENNRLSHCKHLHSLPVLSPKPFPTLSKTEKLNFRYTYTLNLPGLSLQRFC